MQARLLGASYSFQAQPFIQLLWALSGTFLFPFILRLLCFLSFPILICSTCSPLTLSSTLLLHLMTKDICWQKYLGRSLFSLPFLQSPKLQRLSNLPHHTLKNLQSLHASHFPSSVILARDTPTGSYLGLGNTNHLAWQWVLNSRSGGGGQYKPQEVKEIATFKEISALCKPSPCSMVFCL